MRAPERRLAVAAATLTIAIGLSVRFPITSVSALLAEIGVTAHLGTSGLAVLSMIPVLLFALASPLAPILVFRLGLERAISVLLAVLALATLLRPLSPPLLYGGTVLVGGTIALLGILAPQLIRRFLPERGGFWTGVYTTSFGVSAALGAALTVPLLGLLDGNVGATLSAWGVPLLVAFALALVLGRRLREPHSERARLHTGGPSILRSRGLWPVTGFFGAQGLVYFALTAWIPTIAADRGFDADQSGLLLAWMSIAGLPASLLAPTLATRPRFRVPLIVGVSTLSAVGLLGLAFGPIQAAMLSVGALGFAGGGAFGLSIALIVFTAPDAARTASFSAVSQGIGYLFAAVGTLLPGLLAQAGVSWSIIVAGLVAAPTAELVFGITACRAANSLHTTGSTTASPSS